MHLEEGRKMYSDEQLLEEHDESLVHEEELVLHKQEMKRSQHRTRCSCNVYNKIYNCFPLKARSSSCYSLDNYIGNKLELFTFDIK